MVTLMDHVCTRLYFPLPRQHFPSAIFTFKCPSPIKSASGRLGPFPALTPTPDGAQVTEDYETSWHYTNGEIYIVMVKAIVHWIL